ncbi:MAG: Uma2 family endonuclease [Calditrichaeota bacterium]|nr:MAG: Uma2 family endonuclease [Calditrichota bacterium]
MSGATLNHNIISFNFGSELRSKLKENPCIVIGADLKIQIEKNGLFAYPNVSVFCGKPEFFEDRNDTITNPILIVEVLSDSTEGYDRGKKIELYRELETLQHYFLVSQKKTHVEHFYKNEKRNWELVESKDLQGILEIQDLEIEISLSEIYSKVEFEKEID